MRRHLIFAIIFFCSNLAPVWADDDPEKERLGGFAEHQNKQKKLDQLRESGEQEFLENEARWADQKNRQLLDYKKSKKNAEIKEDGAEAKADAASKKDYVDQYEKERVLFIKERVKRKSFSREALKLPSEQKELGLAEERPRYDYRKRVLYGANPKWGRKPPGSSVDSFSPSSGGTSFPPPPTFDDFGGDTGYVPAPNMSDDMGDMVPPPPPPMPMGTDFSNGGFNEMSPEFAPPPPPPPFVNEGGF